jgi:hypothetical protein
MIKKSAAMAVNVIGSVALTLTSMLVIARVSPKAATIPAATPIALRRSPCPTTSLNMPPGVAPSAILTPISCVRCRTTFDNTPYSPTHASSAAITAKTPMSRSEKRVPAYARFTSASIGCISVINRFGLNFATSARITDAYCVGSPLVRTAQ